MKIIANKNCTGKTKELIKESLETGNPILALTPLKANSLREKAKVYFNSDYLNVIDFENLKMYDGNVLIDDADEILSELLEKCLSNPNLKVSGMVVNV